MCFVRSGKRSYAWRPLLGLLLTAVLLSWSGEIVAEMGASVGAVESSLGRVLLINDKTWRYEDSSSEWGDTSVMRVIDEEYKNTISKLPANDRVVFFWSIFEHVHLDGVFLEDFLHLVAADCGTQFVLKAESFLNRSEELGIRGPDQKKYASIRRLMSSMLDKPDNP